MADRRRTLVTVSGTVPADLEHDVRAGRRPRADYVVIAEHLDADVADVATVLARGGRLARLIHRVGGTGALLGWYVFRRRADYDVVLTDGEQVGIPLAVLMRCFGRRGLRHAMIVHTLSVPKKQRLLRLPGVTDRVDRYFVYCAAQAAVVRALGVDESAVVRINFMVDTEFFDPAKADVAPRRVVSSAGLERRDYPTLMAAVDGLEADVVIAAASPWSKQPDSSAARALPSNVRIERLDLHALRDLYAESAVVVMPLVEIDFQAGITTILEAMSMAKPVVCTRTTGQTDTIVDDVQGVYVEPGDPDALRAAIVGLLDDESRRIRLGARARDWAVAHADVDVYASTIASVVDSLRD